MNNTRALLIAPLIVAIALLAGCEMQETQVPVPDPDEVDVPDVDVPEVDTDVELPEDVNASPGDVDIEPPSIDFEGGNFDINVTNPDTDGRVMFAITDVAADMERISSVFVDFDGTHLHRADTDDWEEVLMFEERYDLLELRDEERTALISDDEVEAGTYDMMRLDISESTVDDFRGRMDAAIPAEEWLIEEEITVTANQTTVILLDIRVNESLHVATDDETYVFLPVFELTVYENAMVTGSDENMQISGDTVVDREVMGQRAEGDIVAGVPVNWDADIDVDVSTEPATITVPTADVDAEADADAGIEG